MFQLLKAKQNLTQEEQYKKGNNNNLLTARSFLKDRNQPIIDQLTNRTETQTQKLKNSKTQLESQSVSFIHSDRPLHSFRTTRCVHSKAKKKKIIVIIP